ncbi:MAG: DUF3592 domain-containing protein [Thermoanaerobaculia bacterium]|nr:DUF3592 domain-containing protein [Thermoanaerobaculia bacterium]
MEFKFRGRRSRGGKSSGTFGKVLVTLFLSLFLFAGLASLVFLTQSSWRLVSTYTWAKTPCVVEGSEHVEPADGSSVARFEVRYRYQIDGLDYRSDVYQRNYQGSDSVVDTQRLAARYEAGTQTHCYVNPNDPEEAVFRRQSLLGLFWLLFPFPFIVPGLGGIWYIWWGDGSAKRKSGRVSSSTPGFVDAPRVESISEKHVSVSPLQAKGCGVLFFGVFFLAGMAIFIPFFGKPMYKVWTSRDWMEVPCTIDRSSVESHPGDDSTTYSIEVLYSYRLGARSYRSDRYSFAVGSDSNYSRKQEVVNSLPPGTRTVCWVNPEDPFESVLSRKLGLYWLFAFLPLIFVAVGLGGIVYVLKSTGKVLGKGKREFDRGDPVEQASNYSNRAPDVLGLTGSEERREDSGPPSMEKVLEPSAGPVAKFAGMFFIALFWNGIVSVFLWQIIKSYREGNAEGCLTLFIIPFVLVGLLLLVSVPYQFMAMFNPTPRLVLRPGRLRTGESSTLAWSFEGRSGRISSLKITLQGEESARYRRGTDTTTATNAFFEETLVERLDGAGVAMGEVVVAVPANTMPSFDGGNNKIIWKIKLGGEIRLWPDVSFDFPIDLEPGEDPS